MDYSKLKIPHHVGIIVDGNGRWAKERGLSRSEGHKEGAKNIDKIIEHVFKTGTKYLSLYVFSTENFKRSKEEVDYLMKLIGIKFKNDFARLKSKNIKVVISGRRESLPKEVLKILDKVVDDTKNNTRGVVNFCLNYGAHAEIVDATKKIVTGVLNSDIKVKDINEELFAKHLYNNLPPIDLVIRTSGEMRISNFMLWQLSYAEFAFPSAYFPAFAEKDYDNVILEYNNRDRRFGGINYEDKNS